MTVYTIRDIARMAGVSVTTVSRVLNHRPDVNPQTREKVEKVIQECHFVGNANARELKQGNDVIGMVVRGRSNPFLGSLAEAILAQVASGADTYVTEYIDEADDEFLTARHLSHRSHLKGLIFVGSRIDERVSAIQELDLPMVFTTVDGTYAAVRRASSVSIDDRAMGRLVGEELVKNGHKKIAVFGASPLAGDSLARRFHGFCEACAERGVSFDPDCYRETRFSLQEGYDTAMEFFSVHPEVTALFGMSDTVAVGAMRALRDMGKAVPGDVSVFGFDGIDIGRFTVPSLSTVEQPVEEIARCSVQLLDEMLDNAPPRNVTVQAVLRIRESLGPART